MELHVKIIGVVLVFLALVHGIFPKYFDWGNELTSVSLINRQLMYVHTFFIALLLLLMGALCITSASEIVQTPLGRKLSLGIAVFWIARLVIQLFGYSSQLWRGRRFETVIHLLFVTLWTYLSTIFLSVYWSGDAG
jgi:hypothetical protein